MLHIYYVFLIATYSLKTLYNNYVYIYCILHGRIKGYRSIILCQGGSIRTVVG